MNTVLKAHAAADNKGKRGAVLRLVDSESDHFQPSSEQQYLALGEFSEDWVGALSAVLPLMRNPSPCKGLNDTDCASIWRTERPRIFAGPSSLNYY
jgi:hypothetical protein